jgi:hypothetical protein
MLEAGLVNVKDLHQKAKPNCSAFSTVQIPVVDEFGEKAKEEPKNS